MEPTSWACPEGHGYSPMATRTYFGRSEERSGANVDVAGDGQEPA
jgi:hypothetical protein